MNEYEILKIVRLKIIPYNDINRSALKGTTNEKP